MDFHEAGIRDALMIEAVGLHFQIEVFLAEDLLKLPGDRHGAGHVFLADQVRNLAAQAPGQRDEPFVMLLKNLLIHPRFIIKSFKVGFTDEFDQILIAGEIRGQQNQMVIIVMRQAAVFFGMAASQRHVGFAADDRLDAGVVGFSIELDGPEHVAVIGHGHGRLSERFDLLDERFDLIRAVEQAELGVEMQMDKRRCHRKEPLDEGAPTEAGGILVTREGEVN